jgi:hypothetical protein
MIFPIFYNSKNRPYITMNFSDVLLKIHTLQEYQMQLIEQISLLKIQIQKYENTTEDMSIQSFAEMYLETEKLYSTLNSLLNSKLFISLVIRKFEEKLRTFELESKFQKHQNSIQYIVEDDEGYFSEDPTLEIKN